MKWIKKLIKKDREMTARTPKKIRLLNFIFLIFWVVSFIVLQFHIITTFFVLLSLMFHPYVFPKLKEIYDSQKLLKSKEFDWLELK